MKKVIAIDLNDVIRAFSHQFNVIYKKFIDHDLELEDKDITNFDYSKVFPFLSKSEYESFRYYDYPYELYARAEMCDPKLTGVMNNWIMNVLGDLDEVPEVIIVSPFEMGLTIQSTLSFLAAHGIRQREYYFPVDSMTIWDRCDVLITANPNLIANVPEGKSVIKIETPYNENVEAEHTFKTFMDVMQDENETLIKLIENE